MDARTRVTTDHGEIRRWAERFEAKTQIIDDALAGADPIGLRQHFPGQEDERDLSESHPQRDISWDDFFALFDRSGLAFTYEDRREIPDPGDYRFIRRDILEVVDA